MVPPIRQFPPARVIGASLALALIVSIAPSGRGEDDDKKSSPPVAPPAKTEVEVETETPSETKPTPTPTAAAEPKSEPKPTPPPAPEPAPVPAPPDDERFPVGTVERPLVVRTFLPNLIEDPGLFPNHRPGAAATGYDPETGRDTDAIIEPVAGLPAAIAVNFGDTLSIAWDTVECRWLYAWRGGFLKINDSDALPELIGDIVYLARGSSPLSMTIGAIAEQVKFYGYRDVDGVPEFLYTIGGLKVAERIQPGDDGKTIVQHFSVERNQFDLVLAAPSAPASDAATAKKKSAHSISVSNGKLDDNFAIIPKKNAGDFALVHTIGAPLERPGGSEGKTQTIPLLTQNSKPPIKARPVILPTATPTATPLPAPASEPASEPASDAKTMVAADATLTPDAQPDTPASTEKKADPSPKPDADTPIIARARRYDREILLTDPHLETGAMNKDSTAFSDRDFKFTQLPDELIGADYVRTFDRDKYIPGDILSYRLELGSDASVYVLIDKRLDPMPKWVDKRFKDTGKTAALDAGRDFRVLRADADAGEFRFGPQDSGAGAHFYIIAATPRGAGAKAKAEGGKPKAESKK